MIEYRSFHNADPPHVLHLWQTCGLGRGAASGLTADQFDDLTFAQPYFDRKGLILATEDCRVIGYVHAGFGPQQHHRSICCDEGVICAVMVHPDYRRRGIGRQLVELAEGYLKQAGVRSIHAGASSPCDPFYFGLYGGTQPSGFLESDQSARPFFEAIGYQPVARHLVLQRRLRETTDPVGLRLITIRRATKLVSLESAEVKPWWWQTRPGRLDTVEMGLIPKTGGEAFASVTVVGLDLFIPRWQIRSIGFLDLQVPESHRGQGYEQALIVEVCRRLKEEMIGLAEVHIPAENTQLLSIYQSAGFKEVDAGLVYRRDQVPPLTT